MKIVTESTGLGQKNKDQINKVQYGDRIFKKMKKILS